MPADKFSAVWVSHTSINDFLTCPRSYYLKNVYKDPKTGHKMKIMSPPLALGQAVHEAIEQISQLPTADRLKESLVLRYHEIWKKVSGKRGGFLSPESETQYKNRGEEMLLRIMKNPGPVAKPAVKIKESLPHYWLSEEKNIILCGKVDWLEYLPDTDSVHIIDFKTSKTEEKDGSLQLPIYHLLVHNTQKRDVSKASYWYLGMHDYLTEKELPDLKDAHDEVLDIAIHMKTARKLQQFKCPKGEEGCFACRNFEAVLRGEAEFVGVDEYNADIYILPPKTKVEDEEESVIL
ncbi:MAG: RecB family exonuclease [Patescibacteria group bacterium]